MSRTLTTEPIHKMSHVDPKAEIGDQVEIGPFCFIGPNVKLGNGVKLHSHVVVTGCTTIGDHTEIFPFAIIGAAPQDKKYRGEESRLEVGSHNIIREHVTMNGGTEGGNNLTKIGSHGLFLVGAHVAHDCQVGDNVILVNHAAVAGHVHVGNYAILGGHSAVHQWVRIGEYAFVGGMSAIDTDIIPFGMAVGNRAYLAGLNIVGLKRQGFEREQIHSLRKAYRLLFSQEGTLQERLEDVEKMFYHDANVAKIISFMRSNTDRSFCVPRAQA